MEIDEIEDCADGIHGHAFYTDFNVEKLSDNSIAYKAAKKEKIESRLAFSKCQNIAKTHAIIKTKQI